MLRNLRSLTCLLVSAVPLLYAPSSRSGPEGDIKVWPVFYHATDPVSSEARTEVLWPFYVRHHTDKFTANQILSFPQRYPSRYPSQFYLFWPFSGIRTGSGHDVWLFPSLWSGASADGRRTHLSLFPAFYYGRRNDRLSLNIGLLQHNSWSRNPTRKNRFHALWPIAWSSTSSSNSRHHASGGILPLFWLSHSEYHGPKNRTESRSGGVLLLNWWRRYKSESIIQGRPRTNVATASDGLFPLFYRFNSDNTSTAPGQDSVRHNGRLWLFPYWQSNDTRSTTDSGGIATATTAKSSQTLFPLWWKWSGEKNGTVDSGHLVLPIWWHSTERRGGELDESADFLVPIGAHLFKKGAYETQNLLGPVFNRTENKIKKYVRYDAFFPFFSTTRGENRTGGHIFPLAGWGSERGEYSNLWYLFPLGWHCESQENETDRGDPPRFWALHEMERRPVANDVRCLKVGPHRTVAFYPFAWSKRQANRQLSGLIPLWWQDTWRHGRTVATNTWLPLILGRHGTTTRDGRRTASRQNCFLSILAWGKGEQYKFRRLFPLISYGNSYGSRYIRTLLPPFSYQTWQGPKKQELHRSAKLAVPFRFLPVFGFKNSQNGADISTGKSWFFPLYKWIVKRTPSHETKKLSVLWPLWNAEWENGETRVRTFGGVAQRYEKDANGFVEQRILYRVFTRRTRSWLSEREFMPFYAQQSIEGGDRYWKFLGGLLGTEAHDNHSYLRLLYIPIPLGKVRGPDAAALAKRQMEHADLALNYLRHGRHDRAAIEFKLAGNARANDRGFELSCGEGYLKAKPEAVGRELRSSVPASLKSLVGTTGYSDTRAVREKLRKLAVQHFENAIRLGADEPDVLREIARAYWDIGQFETAFEKLARSDRLRPSFATAMDRLLLMTDLILTPRRPRRSRTVNVPAVDRLRTQRIELLGKLEKRYPTSPTLVLWRAEMPENIRYRYDPVRGVQTLKEAFSPATMKRLALYERGAEMRPGAEEKAWLMGNPSSRMHAPTFLVVWFMRAPQPRAPWHTCAVRAMMILNRQVTLLLDAKRTTEAEKLLPRIAKLMDRIGGDDTDSYWTAGASRALGNAMANLSRLYLKMKKAPLAYIATAEEWATHVCPRLKKVIEQRLESVRLDQQYLKHWHIAPVAGSAVPVRTYTGKFFDRYVDLDAILDRPDHCTAAAECVLVSTDERRAVLRLGFDETLTAELNGQTVFRGPSRRVAVRDEFTVPIMLHKGENRLKLTVTDKTLGYGFFARLSDEHGDYMKDVTCRK